MWSQVAETLKYFKKEARLQKLELICAHMIHLLVEAMNAAEKA